MLGASGMYDQDILFTDFLVQGVEVGNAAGYFLLAMALMIAVAAPEVWATKIAAEEVDGCLIDDFEGPVCGPVKMLEDMVCVEQTRDGKPQWVCA